MKKPPARRVAIKNLTLGATALLTANACSAVESKSMDKTADSLSLKGKVKHSVCRWCYGDIPFEAFCEQAKDIGLGSIELTGPAEWPILQKYGLTSALANTPGISLTEGFNNPKLHGKLLAQYTTLIDQAADFGLKQVIVFSGNRNGISDEAGLEYCAQGLDAVMKHAEKRNMKVCMELLNSKVDHADYQCDKTSWGAALVDKLGSSNFKLLYDIYHMQIMEGDVIATIRKYKDYISHFHTGGVPGRNEIDETQELYYPAILQAIVDTGYKGWVAQEFIPKGKDPMASLRKGVEICDV